MWAIIGGTGLENYEDLETLEPLPTDTPFGECSSGLKRVKIHGKELLFLPRHGIHHEHTPTTVNYRANIFALKKYGATKVLAISATGSLREELEPGHVVVPTQYIDHTKCRTNRSFAGDGFAAHISLGQPTSLRLTESLKELEAKIDFPIHFDKTYICIEGPGFSTMADSHVLRLMGGDIVGMTNFPEFLLAREAGIHYLPCSFVTDYDSWKTDRPPVTQDEVTETMRGNYKKAHHIVKLIVENMYDMLPNGCPEVGIGSCLLTPEEQIPDHIKSWLEILKQ